MSNEFHQESVYQEQEPPADTEVLTTALTGISQTEYKKRIETFADNPWRGLSEKDFNALEKSFLRSHKEYRFRKTVADLLEAIDTSWVDRELLAFIQKYRPQLVNRYDTDLKELLDTLAQLRLLKQGDRSQG